MKTKRVLWFILSLLLVSSMVLAACAPAPEEPVEEPVAEEVVEEEVVEEAEAEETEEEAEEPAGLVCEEPIKDRADHRCLRRTGNLRRPHPALLHVGYGIRHWRSWFCRGCL